MVLNLNTEKEFIFIGINFYNLRLRKRKKLIGQNMRTGEMQNLLRKQSLMIGGKTTNIYLI